MSRDDKYQGVRYTREHLDVLGAALSVDVRDWLQAQGGGRGRGRGRGGRTWLDLVRAGGVPDAVWAGVPVIRPDLRLPGGGRDAVQGSGSGSDWAREQAAAVLGAAYWLRPESACYALARRCGGCGAGVGEQCVSSGRGGGVGRRRLGSGNTHAARERWWGPDSFNCPAPYPEDRIPGHAYAPVAVLDLAVRMAAGGARAGVM